MIKAETISAEAAKKQILWGEPQRGMIVDGALEFNADDSRRLLSLPEDLTVRRLVIRDCHRLQELPHGLHCNELIVERTPLTAVPEDIQVKFRLEFNGCDTLEMLPTGLKVGTLVLRGCTSLHHLPEGLDVWFLDMPGCVRITDFPAYGPAEMGRLNIRGCTGLRALPGWLKKVSQLDIGDCTIAELPVELQVLSWLDVADIGMQALPAHLTGVQLRWRGVMIDERIAFRPQTIFAQDILKETNVERRRVMMERLGYETFLEQVNAEELDQDSDPGGIRRLLRVQLEEDEPLVCLSVKCPSTGRGYLLRVPPQIASCHQAAAWIAGFDDPEKYRPLAET